MPCYRLFLILFATSIFSACSTTRKLSRVGLRDPSSIESVEAVSALRLKFSGKIEFSAKCPKDFALGISTSVMQKIMNQACHRDFLESYPLVQSFLKTEERALVDAIYLSGCSSLEKEQLAEPLKIFLDSFELTGPKTRGVISENEVSNLNRFKSGLQSIYDRNIALEKWTQINGSYLLAEADLRFYEDVLLKRSCVLTDYQLEDIQERVHSVEDLLRILPDEKQIENLQLILRALYRLVDTKVSEYFGH